VDKQEKSRRSMARISV